MTDPDEWLTAYAVLEQEPERVSAWVDRTVAAVLAAVPELDGELAPVLRAAVQQQWCAFLDKIVNGTPFVLVPAAHTLALELPRRRLGLPILVRAYRSSQRASWDYATAVVRGAPGELDHEALLVRFWTEATDWLDVAVEASILVHQEEARRLERRGDTQRLELVTDLLAGEAKDPTAASAALGGYAVTGSHVALIARALVPEAIGTLESQLLRLASMISARRPLIVAASGREVWCWVCSDTLPDPGACGAGPAADRLRITIGGPGDGLEGFVQAHEDARAAQVVALESPRAAAITCYSDVAALVLLSHDHAAARRFTLRTLGGLAAPEAGRLRETVRAVLGRGSGDAVARELAVHKNTVRYRVAQAEQVLGHPLSQRPGDLLLALEYFDAFLAPQS